jgi:hypothetical protein
MNRLASRMLARLTGAASVVMLLIVQPFPPLSRPIGAAGAFTAFGSTSCRLIDAALLSPQESAFLWIVDR